jgi:hypothetical protein
MAANYRHQSTAELARYSRGDLGDPRPTEMRVSKTIVMQGVCMALARPLSPHPRAISSLSYGRRTSHHRVAENDGKRPWTRKCRLCALSETWIAMYN